MSDTHAAAVRRWAFQWLGLPTAAAPEAMRTELFERLAEADFLPSAACRVALRLVADPAFTPQGPEADEFLLVGERQLHAASEALAGEFFRLPPDERRRRWQELTAWAESYPALQARLQALEPGLDLQDADFACEDSGEAALVEQLRELFVLRRGARAALRRQYLDRARPEFAVWAAAARRLRQQRPRLALLDPDLIALLTYDPRPRAAIRDRAAPLVAARRTAERPTRSTGFQYLWPLVVVASIALRGLMTADNHSHRDNSRPAPTVDSYYTKPRLTDREELLGHELLETLQRVNDGRTDAPPVQPEYRQQFEEWKRLRDARRPEDAPLWTPVPDASAAPQEPAQGTQPAAAPDSGTPPVAAPEPAGPSR